MENEKTWMFGRGSGGGSIVHACRRNYLNSEESKPVEDIMGGGGMGLYTIQSLCPQGRGGRVTNKPYEPARVNEVFGKHAKLCQSCLRRWNAREAPQIEGFTRTCSHCNEEKNVSQFHVDRRTRDGISKNCLDCEETKRAVVESATFELQMASDKAERMERARNAAAQQLELMSWRQENHFMLAHTCTQGHVLVPTIDAVIHEGEYPKLVWTCECGDTPVQPQLITAAHLMREATNIEKENGIISMPSY